MKRTCPFCGGPGPTTREHAWPAWALTLVGGSKDASRAIKAEQFNIPMPEYSGPGAGAVFKKACARCNNDRFVRQENAARPTLERMIMGLPVMLDEPAQATVAGWAIKTTMVFDVGATRGDPHFSDAVRKAFVVDGEVPANTVVRVGACSTPWDVFSHGYRQMRKSSGEWVWYLSAIAIAQFFVQVAHEIIAPDAAPREINPDPDRRLQILPFVRPFKWPPSIRLNGDDVWAVASPTPRTGA
jgi:hypothetical protein